MCLKWDIYGYVTLDLYILGINIKKKPNVNFFSYLLRNFWQKTTSKIAKKIFCSVSLITDQVTIVTKYIVVKSFTTFITPTTKIFREKSKWECKKFIFNNIFTPFRSYFTINVQWSLYIVTFFLFKKVSSSSFLIIKPINIPFSSLASERIVNKVQSCWKAWSYIKAWTHQAQLNVFN